MHPEASFSPRFSASHDGAAAVRPGFPSGGAATLFSDASALKSRLGKQTGAEGEAWFSPLSFTLRPDTPPTLLVTLPHPLFFRWFSMTGRDTLEKSARALLGAGLSIRYDYAASPSLPQAVPAATAEKNGEKAGQPAARFEHFLVGGQNRDVLRLFRSALSASPCPILLLGPSGTGKSLLLRAAEEELKQQKRAVLFLSCRDLIALFRNSPQQTLARMLSSSAVLLDDIQLLEQHEDIQKELAAQLDAAEGRAFFLASYRTDEDDTSGQKLLPFLYDRLCSHLSLTLAEPDLDVRLRFAQECMTRAGLPEHRGLALAAARGCLRLRHIRGLLEQVRMSYEQKGVLPSPNEFSSLIGRSGIPQPPDVAHILAVVAARYGCTSSQLCENTKERALTLPRQIAMYLCRELLGESYPSLGLIFGGKDHSTVIYAIKKISNLRVTNKDMHIQLTELTKQCRNGTQYRSRGG